MSSRRKVVLYNPSAVFYTMPLGLMAVASNLDRSKYDVMIIDGRLESDPVATVLSELEGALCLGVSVLTGAPIGDALAVLRAAKAKYPDLVTVCGGWHPSLFPIEMLSEPCIDVSVRGQGEATFANLLACLDANGSLREVAGIAYRDDSGPVQTAERAMLPMDVFPSVDYDLIPVERYFSAKRRRQIDYISSTGCLFRCAFCADPFVYKRGWQAIAPDRVGAEIERLWNQYQFTDLNFQDETFFTYRDRVAQIAEQFMSRQLRFTWAATLRADQGVRLGEEIFELCVKSGMRRVLIGVESGSPAMLKRITKDTTVEQILESADMCRRNDVAVIFSFIVGFPGESEEDLSRTVELVKKLRAMSPKFETPIFYYKPYPGSALSTGLEEYMPTSLDDWAKFDYVQGSAGPWVSAKTWRYIERFKFYNRHAWGHPRVAKLPLRSLARWRCKRNWYRIPIEKAILQKIRPETELS